jgi:hypothetical protein
MRLRRPVSCLKRADSILIANGRIGRILLKNSVSVDVEKIPTLAGCECRIKLGAYQVE